MIFQKAQGTVVTVDATQSHTRDTLQSISMNKTTYPGYLVEAFLSKPRTVSLVCSAKRYADRFMSGNDHYRLIDR